MGVMLKPNSTVAVEVERISSTKTSTDESAKRQGYVSCVFWLERHVRHEFALRGQMLNKQLYREVLACLGDGASSKRSEM